MGKFGWDLPPGCSVADIDRQAGGDVSPESMEVYGILDDAEVEQTIIDKVIAIVDRLADQAYADRECPVCAKRMDELEAKEDEMFRNGIDRRSLAEDMEFSDRHTE